MAECGKRCYTGPETARRQTRHLANRTRVYYCLECGAWHITNQDVNGKYRTPLIELAYAKPKKKRKSKVRAPERKAKLAAKERDHWRCRWPGCGEHGKGIIHAAHLEGKGMGGDPLGRVSDKPSDYISLCAEHHAMVDQYKVELLVTDKGGDGPVEFRAKEA